MEFIPELLRRNVLPHVIIELQLLPRQWINERRDKLEETIDNPRDYILLELLL